MNVKGNDRILKLEKENAELKAELAKVKKQDSNYVKWLQTVIDSIPNPVFMKNAKREFVLCNVAFAEMFGLSASELYGKKDEDFSPPEEVAVFKQKDEEILANGITNWNQEFHSMNGVTRTILTSKARLEDENGNYYVLGSIADITDDKNQQAVLLNNKNEIKEQQKNIEILIKEVHHRVKNNLQIIISLLNLQISKNNNPEVTAIIANAQNRIYSMAKIHQILCEGDNLSSINLQVYLDSLIRNIRSSFRSSRSIVFTTKVQSLLVDIEMAIPIGLIVNEIITNSIKYGHVKNGAFEIYLKLNKDKIGKYVLAIGDNGESVSQSSFKPSLGSELIDVFSEQLGAQYTTPNMGQGVHYSFIF